MKGIFSLLLTFIVLPSCAQVFFKHKKIVQRAYYENGFYARLNVLSVADIALPTVQPGIEYKVNDRWGFEFAFGIPLNNLWTKRETDTTFYHFYKLRATAKYYTTNNFYIGFETFFVHNRYSRFNERYIIPYDGYYTSDYTVTNKNVVGFDLKYGKAISLGRDWYLENFIGLGLRIVNTKLPVNINQRPSGQPNYAFAFLDEIGTKYTPHLTYGLLIVYKL